MWGGTPAKIRHPNFYGERRHLLKSELGAHFFTFDGPRAKTPKNLIWSQNHAEPRRNYIVSRIVAAFLRLQQRGLTKDHVLTFHRRRIDSRFDAENISRREVSRKKFFWPSATFNRRPYATISTSYMTPQSGRPAAMQNHIWSRKTPCFWLDFDFPARGVRLTRCHGRFATLSLTPDVHRPVGSRGGQPRATPSEGEGVRAPTWHPYGPSARHLGARVRGCGSSWPCLGCRSLGG